jgi:hypothetical protein
MAALAWLFAVLGLIGMAFGFQAVSAHRWSRRARRGHREQRERAAAMARHPSARRPRTA